MTLESVTYGNGRLPAPASKCAPRAGWRDAGGLESRMQIGVYGSGYLRTVISACLADFGTPVTCCHADTSRILEIAQGNLPFFQKNLKELIRRKVRPGRLRYSPHLGRLARCRGVVLVADDTPVTCCY